MVKSFSAVASLLGGHGIADFFAGFGAAVSKKHGYKDTVVRRMNERNDWLNDINAQGPGTRALEEFHLKAKNKNYTPEQYEAARKKAMRNHEGVNGVLGSSFSGMAAVMSTASAAIAGPAGYAVGTAVKAAGMTAVMGVAMGGKAVKEIANDLLPQNKTMGKHMQSATKFGAELATATVAGPAKGLAYAGMKAGKSTAVSAWDAGRDTAVAGKHLWDNRNTPVGIAATYGIGAVVAMGAYDQSGRQADFGMKMKNTTIDSNGGGTFLQDSFTPNADLTKLRGMQGRAVQDLNASGELVFALHSLRNGG